jgi:hydrogenase nickel incorporation protein HypA/HybF
MHELSIAQNILDIATDQAKDKHFDKIISIKVKIGELAAVDPGSLLFSFDIIKAETKFSDVTLEIEEIPLKCFCENCETESKIDNFLFVCANCESTNIKVISGEELTISEIEVE